MPSTPNGTGNGSSDAESRGEGNKSPAYQPPAVQASPTTLSDDLGNDDKYENAAEAVEGVVATPSNSKVEGSTSPSAEKSGEPTGTDGQSRGEKKEPVVFETPPRRWRGSGKQLGSPETMRTADTQEFGTPEFKRVHSSATKTMMTAGADSTIVSFDYTDGQSTAYDSFLHEDSDYYYVKQKFGYLSIGLSTTQLFILAVQMLLCGVAPFDVNPMVGPYPDVISEWGGRNTYLIVDGLQIWRLITPFALHSGVIHLLCNVAVQLETAAFFEREWGSARWAVLYLSGAFGCNLASSIISPDEISVASSGALMGLFGAKLAEVTTMSLFQTRRRRGDLGNSVRLEQLGGVLCAVAVVGLFTLIPYVDYAGHLGGLCGGFSVGVIIFATRLQSTFLKFAWLATGVALVVAGVAYSLLYLFQYVQLDEELGDVCEYFRRLFAEGYDCNCLA
uniref:rhomboid protease n=1 Tax=Ditylum brightwellii TaxID=49249 RepID=A0A7S4QRS8_9STRA